MDSSKEIIKDFFEHKDAASKEIGEKIKLLKKRTPKDLDSKMQDLHEKWFEKIDCLDCANCCSTISPAVKDVDISRLAKHLRVKPSQLVEQYFNLDSDGDYVFKETPCPFLLPDNYCSVYEARPKACREYPHTNRRRAVQLLPLTKKNCKVCPAVFNIIKEINV